MPYAVIRVAKLKTQAHALAATAHNYRQRPVANAEHEAARPNREYVNHEQKDYWSLAEARIQDVGVKRVRSDSVRAMEVILTGSPEAFVRDQGGRAADYSKSKWAQDNLHFLQERYGAKNVVSFTLHQDEKTPHIHAVVVPITEDNRLSADKLFNPQSLRQLQTDYAVVMEPHGMARGVEHSQAQHQPMRRLYGQETQVARQVAALSQAPPAPASFELREPPLLGRDEWRRHEEARINAEIERRVAQERERATELAKLAQTNTAAAERVRSLQKMLHTSEAIKQNNYQRVHTQADQVRTAEQRLAMVAVQVAQGEQLAFDNLLKQGQAVRQERLGVLVRTLEAGLAQRPFPGVKSLLDEARAVGFEKQRGEDGKNRFVDTRTPATFLLQEVQPNGRPLKGQVDQALQEKHAEDRLAFELSERRRRGQANHEGRAVLELAPEQLDQVQRAFSAHGAGVRPSTLENGRVRLEVLYHHNHGMVAGVSKLLDRANELPGVKLEEDSHDHKHRQAGAVRVEQEHTQQRTHGKQQNRGLER